METQNNSPKTNSKENSTKLSEKQFFEILAEAEKQYEQYLAVTKLVSFTDQITSYPTIKRDMNFPLTLSIKK